MNKVKIIVDSTVDMPVEMLNKLDVEMISLGITFGPDKLFHDQIDITTEELYKKVKELKTLPKTVAFTPADFMKVFSKYVEDGYDVVFTGIGSGFSSSHNNAVLVAEEFDGHVEVVDSGNLSTGIGLLILKAVKDRDMGKDAHEIAAHMRELVPLVKSQFVVDTMEYLHKGGRCSGVARLFGTILKIHPVIAVREKKMIVDAKLRGKIVVGLDYQLDMLKEDLAKDNVDMDNIFVTHAIAPESAAYLLPKVKELCPNANVLETVAGCTVSTHCGPGTIGILWITKGK